MHPLAELGLGPDADERAVKRAYAVRLRSARPDVDPEGFQKLRKVYEAALSLVRMRAAEEEFEPVETDAAAPPRAEETDAPPPATRGPSDLIATPDARLRPEPRPRDEPSPAPSVPWNELRPVELREPADRFVFDIESFMSELYAEAGDGDAPRLRGWLERKSAYWPFAAKPVIAHHVLEALIRDEPAIALAGFDEIASFFGFDDVLSGTNAFGLAGLRTRLWAADDLRDRRAKFAELLRPDRRAELHRYMSWTGRGGYGAVSTRLVAWMLTSPHAYRIALLLRPVPFVTRIVVAFVANLDEGRTDALSPPVDARALSFWFWADARREANRKWRYAAIFAVAVAALYLFGGQDRLRQAGGGSGAPSEVYLADLAPRDRELVRLSQSAEALAKAGKHEDAVRAYDELIASHQPPWSDRGAFAVAAAYYNSAISQQRLGRADDALRTYGALEQMFGKSKNLDVQRVVASGLINVAGAAALTGDAVQARDGYAKVIDTYRAYSANEIRTLVALAFAGRAQALARLGDSDGASSTCREFLSLYGGMKDDKVVAAIANFRGRDCRLN